MYIRNREFILPETEGMKRRNGKLGWREGLSLRMFNVLG